MDSNYRVSSDMKENTPVLVVEGDITSESDSDIMKTYASIKEKHNPANLIINFENVTMVTSAGMHALVQASLFAKKFDRRVIILWPEKEVLKMAETLGVYNYLIFAQSVDEAKMKIKFFT